MSLCGRSFEVDMHLIMTINPKKKLITWRSKKRNFLMKNVEGRFHIFDLATAEKQLHNILPAAMSSEELNALLSEAASAENTNSFDTPDKLPLASLSLNNSKSNSRSIVVFQQEVMPFMSPPPGLRTLFRKHLAGHFENIIADLQKGAMQGRVAI